MVPHVGGRKPEAWGWHGEDGPAAGILREHMPKISGMAAVVSDPAPCRGATKAKARGVRPRCNTFEHVDTWIWDTGAQLILAVKRASLKTDRG